MKSLDLHLDSGRSFAIRGLLMLALTGAAVAVYGADLRLAGDQEVPPVKTTASGSGTINVANDGSVTGSVTTTGMTGTMAHIHAGGPGVNGPVIIPLTKSGDSMWNVPPGAKLNAEQMARYKAGDLYVNVHTEANKGGEVRAQLKP
ncbi:MAG TPA: CHRD domain-containing protein [Burkholderiaceae bacterium]|nr:CHRD domain-containing protein [Burkholderiaceae bacterium]